MVPFWLPPVLALVLGVFYLFAEEGRWVQRTLVAGVIVVSFVLKAQGGIPAVVGLVSQVAVCVFVITWMGIRS